jgi:dinuclear metal center YbgI/SA1388 family protein
MQINSLIQFFEELAPLSLQEPYDNSGLLVGDPNREITGVLITIDITEEILEEAVNLGANLIISHHPIIFNGLKKLVGTTYSERSVIMAIKNDVAIYAAHTNLDNILQNGVNSKICQLLGLQNIRILQPVKGQLQKLIVFVPEKHADSLMDAMFEAGAGKIGNYDACSFKSSGTGTFRAGENTNPFVGKKNELHAEPEIRLEIVVPSYRSANVIKAMKKIHPYEEVAYDLITLQNEWSQVGAGMVGEISESMDGMAFLGHLKKTFNTGCIRHTEVLNKKVKKIAVCGGAGSFLLKDAIKAGADVFVTGDFKYHQFFDAERKLIIADIGHYESEQFTKELFYEFITRKFSTFAVHLSKINTNPIKYL